MSDAPPTGSERKYNIATMACVVVTVPAIILSSFAFFRSGQQTDDLPLLSINQLAEETGTFEIADSDSQLKIEELPTGEIDLTVSGPNATILALIGFEPDSQITHSITVNKGFKWFAVIDEYHNLWVCSAPKASSSPYVLVQGLRFMPPDNQLIPCVESVTDTGHWLGVPSGFLARIHKDYTSTAIPETAPQYTAEQSQQIRRLL